MIKTFFVIALSVLTLNGFGQDCLRVAPPSVCGIISIEKPKLVADAIEAWLKHISEQDDFINLLVPSIIESKSDYEEFVKFAIDGVELFGDTKYLTVFVDDDYSIGVVARFGERQAIELDEWRVRQLPPIQIQEVKPDDFFLAELIRRFAPTKIEFGDFETRSFNNCVILASNKNFADVLKGRVEKLSVHVEPIISDNRRFARSFSQIKQSSDSIGFAYFVPTKFAPFISEIFLEKKTLAAFGIDELVSCSVDFRLEMNEEFGLFSVSCFMPTTVPRVGLSALWETYPPIDVLPPLTDFFANNKPNKLRIENKNKVEFWEKSKAIYEARHGVGSFAEGMDKQHADLGGFKTIFNSTNGKTATFWFSDYNAGGMVRFTGIESRDGAIEYQRELADFHLRNFGKYPHVELEMDNNRTSWFRSESDAKEMFIADYGRIPGTNESLQNQGAIVGKKWTVFGEKNVLLSQSLENFDSNVEFANEIKTCFPEIGTAVFSNGFQPSWLEVNWTDGRRNLIDNFRYGYLKKKYKGKALEQLSQSKDKKHPHITPEDYPDRLFALSEIILSTFVLSLEADITEFRCSGSNNEWRYLILTKSVTPSNRNP